ncbi:hypothetical protein AB4X15_02920 [Peribacillus simplex]|uniref:hypothetical protein n=1 Tax=Peribacillus simplex TaxID=1478 RepID=UPI0034E84531
MKPSYSQYTRKTEKQTSLDRKIERYEQDPIRYETGYADESVKIRSIKGVRLG